MTNLKLVRPVPKPWEESPEASARDCRADGGGIPRLEPNVDDPLARTDNQGPTDNRRVISISLSGIYDWLKGKLGWS